MSMKDKQKHNKDKQNNYKLTTLQRDTLHTHLQTDTKNYKEKQNDNKGIIKGYKWMQYDYKETKNNHKDRQSNCRKQETTTRKQNWLQTEDKRATMR